MAYPLPLPIQTDLNRLLALLGECLELTPAQRLRAQDEYRKVAEWLSRPGSALRVLSPAIYPQGSARLGTEVRPLDSSGGDAAEHDVDAVAEYQLGEMSAMQLYEATWVQMRLNPDFRPIIERKRRCIRLNYPGDFHLDVLPARTDRTRWEPGCIEIPDCELRRWVSSNPKGYALWFEYQAETGRANYARMIRAEGKIPTHAEKPVLNRVVQLWKRGRDVVFKGHRSAPRSIILTTLAARHYAGELEVSTAFATILARTLAEIERSAPRRIEVRNPTNERENFADSWDDISYDAFTQFVRTCVYQLHELSRTTGLEQVLVLLRQMFGASAVDNAFNAYRQQLRRAADSGQLRIERGRGLVTGVAGGIAVPKSVHFGDR